MIMHFAPYIHLRDRLFICWLVFLLFEWGCFVVFYKSFFVSLSECIIHSCTVLFKFETTLFNFTTKPCSSIDFSSTSFQPRTSPLYVCMKWCFHMVRLLNFCENSFCSSLSNFCSRPVKCPRYVVKNTLHIQGPESMTFFTDYLV